MSGIKADKTRSFYDSIVLTEQNLLLLCLVPHTCFCMYSWESLKSWLWGEKEENDQRHGIFWDIFTLLMLDVTWRVCVLGVGIEATVSGCWGGSAVQSGIIST